MKKLHLFKNDPFDIKYKFYSIKIKYLMHKKIKLQTKSLAELLKLVYLIGYPFDDKELELLREVIKRYDNSIYTIEEQYIARYRKYIINDNIKNAEKAIEKYYNNKENKL